MVGLYIPPEILSDDRLSSIQKLVLSAILQLEKAGGCFAHHDHLAKWIGFGRRQTVSEAISDLKKLGLLTKNGNMLCTQNVPTGTESVQTACTESVHPRTESVQACPQSVRASYKEVDKEVDKEEYTPSETGTEIGDLLAEVAPSIRSAKRITAPKHLPTLFERFWKAYPRGKRGEAVKEWDVLQPNIPLAEQIIANVEERVASDRQWLDDGGKWVPHGCRYLSKAGWLDKWTRVNGSAGRKPSACDAYDEEGNLRD